MPTYSLKRFARPEALSRIDRRCLLDLLRPYEAFLAARGLRLSAPGEPPKLDLKQLTDVLVTPGADTPRDLTDALYYTHEMATLEGMDKLLDRVSLADLHCSHLGLEPADVAVRVWLHDRDLLERTHAELAAARPKRFEYFQTYAQSLPVFRQPGPDQLTPLEAALDKEFVRRNRGEGARVFAYPHTWDNLFLVRHGDPYRREETMDGASASSVLYRPLRFDVVIYDPRTGTLRIHAGSKWETSLYRGQFGKHLFGSIDFFPETGRYSLAPLRNDGAASLDCADVPTLKYVALTAVHLNWGGKYHEVEVRKASNIFAALRQRNGKLAERPKMVRASFEVHFRGEKRGMGRPLTLIPPNTAVYSREEDAPVIDQWLAARGFIAKPLPEVHDEAPALLARR